MHEVDENVERWRRFTVEINPYTRILKDISHDRPFAVTEDPLPAATAGRIVFIEEQNVTRSEELDDRDGELPISSRPKKSPQSGARMHIKGDTSPRSGGCV